VAVVVKTQERLRQVSVELAVVVTAQITFLLLRLLELPTQAAVLVEQQMPIQQQGLAVQES
jgi:hypothetical protein